LQYVLLIVHDAMSCYCPFCVRLSRSIKRLLTYVKLVDEVQMCSVLDSTIIDTSDVSCSIAKLKSFVSCRDQIKIAIALQISAPVIMSSIDHCLFVTPVY